MIDWVVVSILLVFGLALLGLELLFIPGTTLVGILGVLCSGYGVFLGYSYFGAAIGTMILIAALIVSVLALYYSFNSGIWERFTLREVISSKFNEGDLLPEVGEEGITLSALRPYGKVEFENGVWEVSSNTDLISSGKKVKVLKIQGKKIIVGKIVLQP